MVKDFSIEKYEELCKSLKNSSYTILTVSSYIQNDNPNKFIILRHDIDKKPENAIKVAKLEKKYGITSTYYFRTTDKIFKPELIKKISDLGHEIGYHYEVLAITNGNFDEAIKLFEKDLNALRKISKIKTICMHGSSLSKWDNKDLWKRFEFRDFNLIGEGYLSIDFNNLVYLSDTGGTWDNLKYRIKEIVDSNKTKMVDVKTTDDVIGLLDGGKYNKIYIVSHPDRWNDTFSGWLAELISKKIRNLAKSILKKSRG